LISMYCFIGDARMTKGLVCFVLTGIAQVPNTQYFLVTVNGVL
jgi:hypothetical protein